MDTTMVIGAIPGWCHPFGALHRHHRVNPTITYIALKAALRKADLSSLGTQCTDYEQ